MTALAYVAHRMPGRARIRVPSQRSHPEYFGALERQLLQHPAIRTVATSPVTGSAVVTHTGELEPILQFAGERGLFSLAPATPEGDETLRRILERVTALDVAYKERTGGKWGLSSTSFYGLLGAAAYQLYRGHFLPPGGTLLLHAIELLRRAGDGRGSAPPRSPPR